MHKTIIRIFICLAILEVCPDAMLAQKSQKMDHPNLVQLRALLSRIKNTTDPLVLTKRDMNDFETLLNLEENQGWEDTTDLYNTFIGNDSDMALICAAIEKIVDGAKRRNYFVKTIIRLTFIVHTNAELGELLPLVVQRVAQGNTIEFLKEFGKLKPEDQNTLIYSALGWPSEINMRDLFKQFASNTKDKRLRLSALRISETVKQENWKEVAP